MIKNTPKHLVLSALIAGALVMLTACARPVSQSASTSLNAPKLYADHFIAKDGYRLPIRPTPQPETPSAMVIALHGFNDYSKAFDKMCAFLQFKNIACLAYDQRGFGQTEQRGLWPGDEKLQSDLDDIVSLIQALHPQLPIYIAGESMGGAVIMTAMANESLLNQPNIRGAVLFAPAVWGRDTQPWYQRWALEIALFIAPWWTPTGESLGITATDNIEALREMSRDPLIIKETRIDTIAGLTTLMDNALANAGSINLPTLYLYGEKDEVIPKTPTCATLSTLASTDRAFTLRVYPEGYHMLTRDLQASTVFSEMSEWFGSQGTKPNTMSWEEVCSDKTL